MRKRLAAFCSAHVWKMSFSFKRFFLSWLSVFAIIWTLIDFTAFFIGDNGDSAWKPPVWLVLVFGVLVAIWLSRPRLTRVVKQQDMDVTIRLTVDDMFRMKGSTAIIPMNTSFKHDHVDSGAVLIQYRDKFYQDAAAFDRQLQAGLLREPAPRIVDIGTEQRKEYPIGTVVRLETPAATTRAAYLIATAKLNEYNRAMPDRSDLQAGLKAVWSYIALRGRKEPLVIPIAGSGRHRITANRLELLGDIVTSFLTAVEQNKFTEQLTIVIHPDAFLRNAYSLDEMEEYIRFRCKFGVD